MRRVLALRLNRITSDCYKKLSYRRGTARCVVSVEILPVATNFAEIFGTRKLESLDYRVVLFV